MAIVKPILLSASSMSGFKVYDTERKDIGDIKDLMLDMGTGRIAYAVLSFGGFLGFGDKLFAIPFKALMLDPKKESFVLNISKEKLEQSRGFDKSNWPDMADSEWAAELHEYYDHKPFWQE